MKIHDERVLVMDLVMKCPINYGQNHSGPTITQPRVRQSRGRDE